MCRLAIVGMVFILGAGCSGWESSESSQLPTWSHRAPQPGSPGPDTIRYFPIPIQQSLTTLQTSQTVPGSDHPVIQPASARREDSLPFHSLQNLPSTDIDILEPVNKRRLSARENGPFPSMITISPEKYVYIQFDNDIFDYTDRFYTSGMRVQVIGPGLRHNPLNHLMVPYWHSCINYYGIEIVQNIYTPSTTLRGGILNGDRPYAGTLYFATRKVSNDALRKVRQSSELQEGILGPSSLAGALQISFHTSTPQNNEPLGWEYQIRNDVLLNYSLTLEKGILSSRNLEINLNSTGILGTVQTHVSGGAYLRTGWFNPYFDQLFFSKRALNIQRNHKNLQGYFFISLKGRFIAYDATLQGGLFNRSSPYTIPAPEIKRIVMEGSAGIVFSYGGIQIKGEQFLLSPEFENGWWHKWLSIQVGFSF